MAAPRLKLKLFSTATLAIAGGLLWLFAAWFAVPVLPSLGQFTPSVSMQFVTVNPSGACKANVPLRYNRVNGNLWGCDSLVWTLVGGTPAPSVFVYGLPLTNASFPRASVSAAGMGDVDIYQAPTGKRVLVSAIGGLNAGGSTVNWFAELKVGSTYYRLQTVTATLAGATSAAAAVTIMLEPGESISVNTSAAGMNFTANLVQFDSTSPLRTVRLLGPATNANTLYTVPAGKTAYVAAGGFAFNTGSAILFAAGSVTANLTGCLILSGGTATCAANSIGEFGTGTNSSNLRNTLASGGISMNAGDMLVFNVSAGDAAQIIWINVLEM